MEHSKNNSKFVYFAALSVNLFSSVVGIALAWPSPFIPKLNGSVDPVNNPLKTPTTLMEDSWIVSLQSCGAISSPIFTGIITGRIGKKKTLLLFSLTVIIADSIMIFANTVTHFYVARFLLGVGTGCAFALIPIYVAEISEVSQRGTTSVFFILMITLFQLVTYIIGPSITIRTMSIINLVPSILFLLTFTLFVPESPYQLVLDNKPLEAEQSLRKLRGTHDVQKELAEITKTIEDNRIKVSIKDLLKSPTIRICLSLSFGLFFMQQFSGVQAILCYLQTLFESANGVIPADKAVMLVGTVQFTTALVLTKLVSMFGRKTLLLFSYIGMLITLLALVVYFYFLNNGYNMKIFSWLPVLSICVYIVCYNMGAGSVAWTIHGEIFPDNLKSYLSSVVVMSLFICAFVITLIFPTLQAYLGITWTLCLFAGFVLGGIVFISLRVQETKDKTFSEIQEMMQGQNKRKNPRETNKQLLAYE